MIHNVLPVIASELNDYLKSRFNAVEDKVILSNIIDQDGSVAIEGSNKVVITLINIAEETMIKANSNQHLIGSSYVDFAPSISVNLTLMISAYFSPKNYVESLRFISGVIYFFQSKPLFTSQNTPGLSQNIDKLHFDLLSLTPHELMNLFSMMGAKYTPSVVYKMKMLTFSQDNIVDEIPAIQGLNVEGETS
ncbi:hypothetical protein C900_02993 [Fulvivirga imtechensis AK7]|uniref:Pvc16 N-terminal domain-containing protein n=1 Tax=Fulvivirga imtechensis AK7 TaxID=1237149 RepID=L8JUG1_9BACT|nr:DUF4255 domain-containing protein [Fulvivirga imtechensis]ELR71189.1 hypothetical protein C900_02993 [Fulvivirga imtechensis AK7]